MRTTPAMPLPVKRALTKLGADIKSARLRRRITTTLMAAKTGAFDVRAQLCQGALDGQRHGRRGSQIKLLDRYYRHKGT